MGKLGLISQLSFVWKSTPLVEQAADKNNRRIDTTVANGTNLYTNDFQVFRKSTTCLDETLLDHDDQPGAILLSLAPQPYPYYPPFQ